jgi:type IV pilus assembly protein PilW
MMKTKIKFSNHGFTLIELLVGMAISGVVMTAVYSTYYSQQKSYTVQEQVVSMQQNLRAAVYHLEREIQLAGCDPSGEAGAGIETANTNQIRVTMDITNDAGTGDSDDDIDDANEDITYTLSGGDLVRDTGSGNETVAENIDALDFVYLDGNGNVLDDDGSGNVTTNISQIRAIQITIIARTDKEDVGFTNKINYTNQQGDTIYTANDRYRRNQISMQVQARNLGF